MEEHLMTQPVTTPPTPTKSGSFPVVIFFLVLILLVGVFLWWYFQHPSRGTITQVPLSKEDVQAGTESRDVYQGKYFTFTYPKSFGRREEQTAVKYPLLERVYLSRSDIEGRKIVLMLQDNAGNAFEEYSSFRIRRNDRSVYTEEKIERNGLTAVLFTKSSSVFEIGAFLPRGHEVLSLVVSSPTTQNGLREEVENLIDSFEWNGQ